MDISILLPVLCCIQFVAGLQNSSYIVGETFLLSDYPNEIPSLIQNRNVRPTPIGKFRVDDGCSDVNLRTLMHQHITDTGITESKRSINNAVKRELDGNWSIICAKCAFSYVAHTQEYCIHSRYGTTCLLYRDG